MFPVNWCYFTTKRTEHVVKMQTKHEDLPLAKTTHVQSRVIIKHSALCTQNTVDVQRHGRTRRPKRGRVVCNWSFILRQC